MKLDPEEQAQLDGDAGRIATLQWIGMGTAGVAFLGGLGAAFVPKVRTAGLVAAGVGLVAAGSATTVGTIGGAIAGAETRQRQGEHAAEDARRGAIIAGGATGLGGAVVGLASVGFALGQPKPFHLTPKAWLAAAGVAALSAVVTAGTGAAAAHGTSTDRVLYP